MTTNAVVDFLATYGPTPAGQSMYDEHVLQGAAQFAVEPISVDSDRIDDILQALTGVEPRSVILTGTAGDGKTWHCRKIFVMLGGTELGWSESGCRIDMDLASGRKLTIIKDLSQYADTAAEGAIVRDLFDSVYARTDSVYLIASNDGRLLRALRHYAEAHPEGRGVEETIRTMLKNDQPTAPGLRLDMWNLSRQSHDQTFERLVRAVTEHDGWSGCAVCENNVSCPILRNREILRASGTTGIKARLRDIIRIAADNDMHLPIRQVLLLIVNTLLGATGRRSPLMNCKDAHDLVQEGKLAAASPYDNVFGLNLGADARTYRAFGILSGFGVGRETNNFIDGILIDQEPKVEYEQFVANDPLFGASVFEDIRKQYRRGEGVEYDDFREAIERQRRRLFFTLPPTERPSQNELDPWRLTVFMHAGEYLAFANGLHKGAMDPRVRNRLAVGLNRSYTGMMCDEGAYLWFAAPAANAQSRIGQVLDIQVPVGKNPMMMVHFDFDAKGPHRSLRMVVRTGNDVVEHHALQPLLFEYLLRVEGGSLPGSFSRQCFEELRQFRLRVVATLAKRDLVDAEGVEGIRIVSLSSEGRLHTDEVGLIPASGP
jgi:hypothetical protein